jgi:hypothetical protein
MKLLFACYPSGAGPPTTLMVNQASAPEAVRITVARHWLRRSKHACAPSARASFPLRRLLLLTRTPNAMLLQESSFQPVATTGTLPSHPSRYFCLGVKYGSAKVECKMMWESGYDVAVECRMAWPCRMVATSQLE